MNEALLSSKNMNWCTPQDFFDKLNEEFSFTLDAAATDNSAKCEKYYTPETDGLKSPWNCGGVLYFAIRLTAAVLVFGWKKHTTKRRTVQRSSFLSRRERIRRIFTTTYTEKRKSVSYAVA